MKVEVPPGFPGRVSFVKSAAKLSQAPHSSLPEICFCGRSNVGKSTLINTLCNRRQLARVSSTPGRTQLINFFDVQERVMLVDLPGYGWAKTPKSLQREWGKTIQEYLSDRPQLALSLLLVDSRREPRDEELNLLEWFAATGRPCRVIVTKMDKEKSNRRKLRLQQIAKAMGLKPREVIGFSGLTKSGREDVWRVILQTANDAAAARAVARPDGPAASDAIGGNAPSNASDDAV